ncbi:MAG: four helix bundle protein [Gemmatimonadaceae bacterium]
MGDFRKLIAWQESNRLAVDLQKVFDLRRSRAYPGIRDQILRAAGSVPDNLAEGCAKRSRLELARSAGVAYPEAKEVCSQIERARGCGILNEAEYQEYAARADRVAKLVFGLSDF